MKLNSQGKLAKFYMWFPPKDKRLPQDLCTFFWGLVGRVFFVFGCGGMVLTLLIFAAVQAGLFLWAHKEGALIFLMAVGGAALVVWLSERKLKFELFSETRQVVKAKVDGVKGRYCPRIDWK